MTKSSATQQQQKIWEKIVLNLFFFFTQ